MNAYVRNLQAKRQADNAVRSDALSILEELRQEAASGPEDAALIERNRRLINGTIDSDPVAPYREVTGADVQGRGIDGPFKKDSTIRLHTEYGKTNDPVLLPSAEQYGIRETGLRTEYLSPQGEQELFDRFAKEMRADPFKRGQDTPESFNRAVQEYYGQQALKLAGNKPVADRDRSYNVRKDAGKHKNTTLSTDRLIETNASMLGGDVGRPAGDYRYMTPEGQLKVGDYQGADYTDPRRPMDATIRLQLIKGSKMSPEQRTRFAGNIREAASQVADIDDALKIMQQRGQLPELVMPEIKQNKRRYFRDGTEDKRLGMRAGKMMSDAPFMGQLNKNDQHRYEHVLYGLQGPALGRLGQGGAVPQGYYNVNTADARRYMADNVGNVRQGADGSAFMAPTLADLLNAGVATDITAAYPQVRQLL